MRAGDDSPDGVVYEPANDLRHELITPLTTISGRCHLLARSIRRSPSLSEEEQATLLAGLAAIEVSVRDLVILIDGMGDERRRP